MEAHAHAHAHALALATWNVLHRIHAINWHEEVAFDERERSLAIAARIAADPDPDRVWCLQEVSGDQLADLRAALPAAAQIIELTYPRVPRLRRPHEDRSPLADPSEHLVIVAPAGAPIRVVHAAAFPSDAGKGALAIERGGVTIINTHVGFGDARGPHCAVVAGIARAAAGPAVMLGDFNADRATILGALGEGFRAVAPEAGSLATRPRSAGGRDVIDHVIVRGAAALRASAVEDVRGLSDHNLVLATVEPRG